MPPMGVSLSKKIQAIKAEFADCADADAIYRRIIELGRAQPPLPAASRTDENLVPGCQSRLYLQTELADGLLTFRAESDALISNGLAYLLTAVLSGESPETLLQTELTYIEELGIPQLLSPTRSNGFASLHLRMKQEALKALVST
jgi:sulfur transfer protein SufE